jgi:hypothetical protein
MTGKHYQWLKERMAKGMPINNTVHGQWAISLDSIDSEVQGVVDDMSDICERLDAIEKRHAEHDAGLRGMVGGTRPVDDSVPLPCPFCGSIKVEYVGSEGVVVCHDCRAYGPCDYMMRADLIAAWNRAKR